MLFSHPLVSQNNQRSQSVLELEFKDCGFDSKGMDESIFVPKNDDEILMNKFYIEKNEGKIFEKVKSSIARILVI